jgi:hypothetical protein
MIKFPGGRQFAFTIFDDTDDASLGNITPVYELLSRLGLRTTKSVWPLPCVLDEPCAGASLQDVQYLGFVRNLKQDGFEIGLHGMRNCSTTRDDIRRGLSEFERLIGHLPRSHSNHSSNRDNLYWGPARLSNGIHRTLYRLGTRFRRDSFYNGHLQGSQYFWGDLCRDHITYVRNFVFATVNLNPIGAAIPYHDDLRPFVKYWFCSCEGKNCNAFCLLLSEQNQDQLEAEGGVCIVYTHLSRRFVENGELNPRFEYLARRLAKKNGWFVPVSTLLDYLRTLSATDNISDSRRNDLERRWLLSEFRIGPT